jgi:hypothetical protein
VVVWARSLLLIARSYRQLTPGRESLQQGAAPENTPLTRGLLALPAFLSRLLEEIMRAERYPREVAIAVFQLHGPPEQQRPVEIAWRSTLRQADIPARLSDQMLGAILPEASQGAAAAAARLALLLSGVASSPITSGFACYPADGQTGADLLRLATERSSG